MQPDQHVHIIQVKDLLLRVHLSTVHDQSSFQTSLGTQSMEQLVWVLIQCAHNELEKARVLFRWIAENIEYDFSYDYAQQKPEDVLKNGKAVCGGYSDLYVQFCRQVSLILHVLSFSHLTFLRLWSGKVWVSSPR